MPVAATAARAAAMSVPCTRTVVGVAPARVVSWSARKPWTGAGDGLDGAAWAGEAMTAAAATAVRLPTPRTRRARVHAIPLHTGPPRGRWLKQPPGAGLPHGMRGRIGPCGHGTSTAFPSQPRDWAAWG